MSKIRIYQYFFNNNYYFSKIYNNFKGKKIILKIQYFLIKILYFSLNYLIFAIILQN